MVSDKKIFMGISHSAVALLLKAALIQVSDYRLLGASGLYYRYACVEDPENGDIDGFYVNFP
jgi:hypothetical protein